MNAEAPPPAPQDLPRRIGFWGGTAIMVGIIIGSGIFKTPASIARQLDQPGLILSLWLAGGILSLFGALTYAELGTMFPRSGGIYVYLHRGFGGIVSFAFGWTYMLITKPMAAAGIGMVFAEHALHLIGISVDPEGDLRAQAVCIVTLAALTVINVIGVKPGEWVAEVLTGLKVMALLAIVALGVFLARGPGGAPAPEPPALPLLMAFSPVMASILWTYDGWSDVASVAGEVRDPQRMLPRIFLVGTAATVALYVAVNAVFMAVVPLHEMRQTTWVVPLVAERLIGPAGAIAATVVIMISTLGASHGSVLTGARVTFAQAQDGLLFGFLGRIHPRFATPAASLWVQLFFSAVAVLVLRSFENLAGGFVFTMWIFYGMSAVAVIVLRVREPELERPYKCWGYPVVPAVFILAAAGMTVLEVVRDPRHTLPWLGVLAAGVPAYHLWRKFAVKPGVEPGR